MVWSQSELHAAIVIAGRPPTQGVTAGVTVGQGGPGRPPRISYTM
jgi:hypothetical protein